MIPTPVSHSTIPASTGGRLVPHPPPAAGPGLSLRAASMRVDAAAGVARVALEQTFSRSAGSKGRWRGSGAFRSPPRRVTWAARMTPPGPPQRPSTWWTANCRCEPCSRWWCATRWSPAAPARAEVCAVLTLVPPMRLNTFLQNVARARKHLLACLAESGVVLEPASAGEPR